MCEYVAPIIRARRRETYADGCGLHEEADEVEVQLSVGRKSYTGRDHEYDDAEAHIRLLDAECPGNEQDRDGVEGL